MSNRTHLDSDGYIVRDNYKGEERRLAILEPNGEGVSADRIHECSEAGLDLAEFFLERRDEAMGVWRYGTWIAREGGASMGGGRTVRLFNERTFKSYLMNDNVMREDTFSIDDEGEREVAREFFRAHPGEPWRDAKAGEVWELETDSDAADSGTYVVSDISGRTTFIPVGHSRVSGIGVNATTIKGGYRTYPTSEEF